MNITIDFDKSCIKVKELQKVSSVDFTKKDLYEIGILKEEVPGHLSDKRTDYYQSIVPALTMLLEEFIIFDETNGQIQHTAVGDRKPKEIAETYGVALGVKYITANFGVPLQDIKGIDPAATGKYLDFRFEVSGQAYELETKGTVQGSIASFKKDIADKKTAAGKKTNSNGPVHLRIGTVAQLSNTNNVNTPRLTVLDDPPEDVPGENQIPALPQYYQRILSFTLDNAAYNKLVKRSSLREARFFGVYVYKGQQYFGDFFDRRLITEFVQANLPKKRRTVATLFNKLTRSFRRHKYFLGVHSSLIHHLQANDFESAARFSIPEEYVQRRHHTTLLSQTGVLWVASHARNDKQIERQFSEAEVKKRLTYQWRIGYNQPKKCGEPCRSREKRGQSCSIMTYKDSCHFHR